MKEWDNMAKRLTDKEKKEIIVYYTECQNYNETARNFNISPNTVKKITNNSETAQKCKQKKEENTKNILEEMSKTKSKRVNLLNKMIEKMEEKVEKVDMFTNVKDLATAYGIIIDKDMKFLELSKDKEEQQNRAIVCIPAKDLPPAFINVYRDILNREHTEYWLEGGRGSIKSSFAGEMVIELLENNPNMCAIVIRRYTNTLKDSVGAQLEWAVSQLSETYPWLTEDYVFKKSPLEAVKRETKQKIYFRGTDDPGKIKSIKPPKGMYIGIIW